MKLPPCEIDRHAPLTRFEKAATGIILLGTLALLTAFSSLCGGCANSPSGVKVTASSASYTNIGDINWDEYKLPVLSLYLGPKATVWVNKDFKVLDEIEIVGTVTNRTEALGIYDAREQKKLHLRLKFGEETSPTNTVIAVP